MFRCQSFKQLLKVVTWICHRCNEDLSTILNGFVKVVKCISSRSKCRDLDHSEMEVVVVVEMVEKGEGKGSRAKGGLGNRTGHGGGGGWRWRKLERVLVGSPPNNIKDGGSTCSHSSSSTRAEP